MPHIIDPDAVVCSLEQDMMDSAVGAIRSTVRPWDRQRNQGRQRRNTLLAPVARSTFRTNPDTLLGSKGRRAGNVIRSQRPTGVRP